MDHFFEGLGNAVHLVAAVVWIGGLAVLVLGMRPALARAIPDPAERDRIFSVIHLRFRKLAMLAAATLLLSGFMMMTTNALFLGFGHYENTWSKLLVAKHALFLGMIGVLFLSRKPTGAKSERDYVDLSLMLG